MPKSDYYQSENVIPIVIKKDGRGENNFIQNHPSGIKSKENDPFTVLTTMTGGESTKQTNSLAQTEIVPLRKSLK